MMNERLIDKMGYLVFIGTLILSFISGSVPYGYICVKKACGIDIRKEGSGNIGSTNVKRVAGGKVSALVMVFDMAKGIVPVLLVMIVLKLAPEVASQIPVNSDTYLSLTALAAILGHDYTPFLKFNGGKGVNTTLGSFLLIAPIPVLSCLVVHIGFKYFSKIVSIKSMLFGVTITVMSIILGEPTPVILTTSFAALLLIYRHKSNISRLIRGEEK